MEAGECLFLCVMFCWCRMRTWCTNRNTLRETAYIEPKESERERERESAPRFARRRVGELVMSQLIRVIHFE